MTDVMDAKSERVDIRVTPNVKRTLQQAAAVCNKTVSEFVLDSSLSAGSTPWPIAGCFSSMRRSGRPSWRRSTPARG